MKNLRQAARAVRSLWAVSPLSMSMMMVCGTGCSSGSPASDPEPAATSQEDLRAGRCRSEADCPQPGAPCHACDDGTASCPEVTCKHHRCTYSFPQCTDPCATVRCSAGTHCTAGACVADGQFCGGIAAIACPGGGKCVDNPNDSCDPAAGGADCGGICTCVENVLCVQGSHFDGSPAVCKCVPDSAATCGKATCAVGEFCCNASCSRCAPQGQACSQIACP